MTEGRSTLAITELVVERSAAIACLVFAGFSVAIAVAHYTHARALMWAIGAVFVALAIGLWRRNVAASIAAIAIGLISLWVEYMGVTYSDEDGGTTMSTTLVASWIALSIIVAAGGMAGTIRRFLRAR
jgi:hypothetical protein